MTSLIDRHLRGARETLPADVVDYFASGAGDEVTVREATEAWARYRLRPRVLRDVSAIDPAVDLLGVRLPHPVGVAPMAFHGLAHPDGERGTARGCRQTGSLFVVSTRASVALEDIAATADPWWFQVYVMRDRAATLALARRAARAGARALVLTGDTPYVGAKRRVAGVRIAVSDEHFLVNIGQHLSSTAEPRAAASQDPSVTLEAIEWLARGTGLPVLVKGVLRGDDAVACVDAGAAGVVVSNHGGRQLDRSLPSAAALHDVVTAVGGRVPVVVDGGLRSGGDALVALALGASAVLLGRPVLWALACDGAPGVAEVLSTVRAELEHGMGLLGAATVADLHDDEFVVPGR